MSQVRCHAFGDAGCYLSYQKFSNDDLARARQLMLVVVEQRKKKLGKEHPYTLWRSATWPAWKVFKAVTARQSISCELASCIAKCNLGPTHIATLFGKFIPRPRPRTCK